MPVRALARPRRNDAHARLSRIVDVACAIITAAFVAHIDCAYFVFGKTIENLLDMPT